MGRRRRFSWASAAVLAALLLPVAVRAQRAPKIPLRCLPQPPKKPSLGLSIDNLDLEGADLPAGVTESEFTDMLEQTAATGNRGWLNRVSNAATDEWRDEGYFQTVVNVQALQNTVQAGVRHVSLRIHVDPGPQFRLEELRVSAVNPGGKLAFADQTLRALIPLHPGEVMNVGKVKQGIAAIERLYASRGYIELQATPVYHVDTRQDQIALRLTLDQGPQFRVGKIVALGFGAKERAILKSKIKSGDIFDWNVVRNFYASDSWLMPPGASVADDIVHRNAKNRTVDLLLDFRSCPKPAKPGPPTQN